MAANENGFLSRHFNNDDLHARIIAVVDRALSDDIPSAIHHDEVEGYARTSRSFWLRHDPDMSAERAAIYGGTAYELKLCIFDGDKENVNARTCLAALVYPGHPDLAHLENVSWQWGESGLASPDESAAAEYLAWWERIIGQVGTKIEES
jgi:hypothetical protein